ncbi:hypothetical protein [Oerskovia enterophila]|uniref:Uncharacterized protein n=1 Tax=Oerskovia enterophila TaxID=43678 RepID=A0A163QU43_9CELL|nr:hypothetical protein [Oerskovia enterophila]KZM34533.1 hypothetical protein OJAG_28320 [Oerskovia enterophila]
MNLFKLREIIINSPIDDWHNVTVGPYFTDAPDIDNDTVEQHSELMVYRHDIDLTIQHGLRARGFDRVIDSQALWPDAHFPDSTAYVEFVDVFWRGVLVDREEVVRVDGGRASIPLGKKTALNYVSGQPHPKKYEFEYSATTWQAALARLVDGDRDWADYTKQAGIVIKTHDDSSVVHL